MRCVRRHSPCLNRGKADDIHALVDAYAKEKDNHLRALTPDAFAGFSGERSYRDHLLHRPGGYTSPHGLQARMWKMAVKDAHETMAKFRAALAEDLKPLVYSKKQWSDEMCHYANWLLYSPRRVAALYAGETPLPSAFEVPKSELSAVVKIVAREVRRRVKRFPRARKARSACFDANMYTLTTSATGRQQVELMGVVPRTRILVPLLGTGAISGNLRVVMEPGTRVAEIHTTNALCPPEADPDGGDAAVDIGQSEVITGDHGRHYGNGFGSFLAKASDVDLDKGAKRAELHAVRKKALASGDGAKARRTVQMRNSTINERSHFKASAAGACRQRVNPAYSSQLCPRCGYVHARNRNGDRFVCLFCGWVGHSDRVGAHNLRNRMDDPDIALWMPKGRVRTVLLSRFSQRTGEAPDWKSKGDCSGVDSRHQVTTAGRVVGADTHVGGDRGPVRPVAAIDHPGQPERETAKEILVGGATRPVARCDAATERGKTTAKSTRS